MSRPALISPHEIRVWLTLKDAGRWLTALEVSAMAKVGHTTAALHLRRFVALGLVERALVFPGYRYRVAAKPNTEYISHLDSAAAVLALK